MNEDQQNNYKSMIALLNILSLQQLVAMYEEEETREAAMISGALLSDF